MREVKRVLENTKLYFVCTHGADVIFKCKQYNIILWGKFNINIGTDKRDMCDFMCAVHILGTSLNSIKKDILLKAFCAYRFV